MWRVSSGPGRGPWGVLWGVFPGDHHGLLFAVAGLIQESHTQMQGRGFCVGILPLGCHGLFLTMFQGYQQQDTSDALVLVV